MRIKTIIILIIVILLTIVFMQNLDPVRVVVLFGNFYVSKVSLMLSVGVIGFALGYLVGRPGRSKFNHSGYDDDDNSKSNPRTLSDEDKDYLS